MTNRRMPEPRPPASVVSQRHSLFDVSGANFDTMSDEHCGCWSIRSRTRKVDGSKYEQYQDNSGSGTYSGPQHDAGCCEATRCYSMSNDPFDDTLDRALRGKYVRVHTEAGTFEGWADRVHHDRGSVVLHDA